MSINNEEVQDKVICDFKKIDYFYILDKEYLGDDEESLYSIEKGLNDYPHIVEILWEELMDYKLIIILFVKLSYGFFHIISL